MGIIEEIWFMVVLFWLLLIFSIFLSLKNAKKTMENTLPTIELDITSKLKPYLDDYLGLIQSFMTDNIKSELGKLSLPPEIKNLNETIGNIQASIKKDTDTINQTVKNMYEQIQRSIRDFKLPDFKIPDFPDINSLKSEIKSDIEALLSSKMAELSKFFVDDIANQAPITASEEDYDPKDMEKGNKQILSNTADMIEQQLDPMLMMVLDTVWSGWREELQSSPKKFMSRLAFIEKSGLLNMLGGIMGGLNPSNTSSSPPTSSVSPSSSSSGRSLI